MKKIILIIVFSFFLFSCKKNDISIPVFKTAYVDTSKLLLEYERAKDLEKKYKEKSEIMGKELENKVKQFQYEANNFQKNAQEKGQAWAQQKGAELQKREQELQYRQQSMLQTLQQESSIEMDSLIKDVKAFIKDFGNNNSYDYIYGTGEVATVLYAKEAYDVTDTIIKALNEKYKLFSLNKDKNEIEQIKK